MDINALNQKFSTASPPEILRWAIENNAGRVALSSSFGGQSAALIHMAIQIDPRIPILFLDTGFLFKETYSFVEELTKKWNLNLRTFKATSAQIAQTRKNLETRKDLSGVCCDDSKVALMQRSLEGLSCWIAGLRRSQGDTRKDINIVEQYQSGLIKVHPLATWTSKQLYAYMTEHALPFHPLWDKGYTSIGCEPCTRLPLSAEDERSGRWAGLEKKSAGFIRLCRKNHRKHFKETSMNSIVAKFIGTWLHPWQAMDVLKAEGEDASIKPYMIYILAMGFPSGLITSLYGVFLASAAVPGTSKAAAWLAFGLVPAVSFIGSFIGAFIIWGLIDGWLKGTAPQYKTSYRVLALLASFSPVSALLAPIPKVGQYLSIAVNIWATIVMIQGIIIVRDTPKVRTWIICLSLFVFLFAVGLMARVAAQRQLQSGNNFGAFGGGADTTLDTAAPADDLGETSDNLDKELQDLANKAEAAPKTDAQPTDAQPKK